MKIVTQENGYVSLVADEEYFRDFFDNGPVGFHIFGTDRKFIDINRTELNMIGYSRREVIGKMTWEDLIVPDQKPLFHKHWEDLAKTGMASNLNYTLIHRNGSLVHVILNATARRDAAGRIVNTRGSVLDVTVRRQVEEQLRLSREELTRQKTALEHKNIALKEVLATIETEKNQIQEDVMLNLENMIFPLLNKMKQKGTGLDTRYLRLVEERLKQLTSGFGRAVSDKRRKLSPKEVEICAMIKNGLSTKEITGLLNTSIRTIDNHRNRIRKKLGVSRQQVNLAVYLQTL